MSKYVYVLALVLASWVLFGNNAMSDTPDEATPAVESVCDVLNGVESTGYASHTVSPRTVLTVWKKRIKRHA